MSNMITGRGGEEMSKGYDEIAAEIVEKLVLARATATTSTAVGNSTHLNTLFEKYLSDDAVAETYKAVYKAVVDASQGK
ncbi:hypothetical protein D3C75_718730 [compost metagenome]